VQTFLTKHQPPQPNKIKYFKKTRLIEAAIKTILDVTNARLMLIELCQCPGAILFNLAQQPEPQ